MPHLKTETTMITIWGYFILFCLTGNLASQCNIPNCNPNHCSQMYCGQCQAGYLLSSSRCNDCSNQNSLCTSCNGSTSCVGCVSGTYGPTCQQTCSCNGGSCNKETGACTSGCRHGYYYWYSDCKKCPTKCTTCINANVCTSCNTGSYLKRSPNGFVSCADCLPRCSSCSELYKCTECKQSTYWGQYCENDCLRCSGNCDRDEGCKFGCDYGSYQIRSDYKGGYECRLCRQSCSSCTDKYDCQTCVYGSFGSYCQSSCQGCTNGICSKNNGCTGGCSSGYFRYQRVSEIHCEKCPGNCTTCASNSHCYSCANGFNGTTCQHDCRNCNADLCDKITGSCILNCLSNQYFDDTDTVCKPCPEMCLKCSSFQFCNSCQTGQWGVSCEHLCSANCKNNVCARETGTCSQGCVSGFHGSDCMLPCLPGCETCSQSQSCNKCKENRYSKDSQYKCDCTKVYCLRNQSGVCNQCSLQTWYPKGSGCCPCSSNCKHSECYTNSTCFHCLDGKYGSQCQIECSSYCRDRLCHRNGTCKACQDGRYGEYCQYFCSRSCRGDLCYRNGTCIECLDRYHGDKCQFSCSVNCRNRLCSRSGNCLSCASDRRYGLKCDRYCSWDITYCDMCYVHEDSSLICSRCKDRWYVENNRCEVCNNNCKRISSLPRCNSTNGFCVSGCNADWFGDKCDSSCNVSNCHLCPDNPNACKECKEGYFSTKSNKCIKCPENCKLETVCEKNNGSCGQGCIDGWAGDKCDIICPSNCITCNQFDASNCSLCINGYHGEQCRHNCSENCRVIRDTQTCYKNNGFCVRGCNNNFWGHTCEKECEAGCYGSVCNNTSGACSRGCFNQYYGDSCDTQCSGNCNSRNNASSGRTCNETNGQCFFGCTPGWFGAACSNKCSRQCNGTSCERSNGTCTLGCIDGYSGPTCSVAKLIGNEDSVNVAAIGAGAGAGVVVLISVSVAVAVLIWRRRQKSTILEQTDKGNVHHLPGVSSSEASKIYSNIDDTHAGNENLVKAGVSNLVYANVRMSDVSKGEETNTTVEIARPVSEDYLKEEEIIDGELAEETESDAGEVDRTYYNVAGKRVAIVKLPEYIRNKSRGEIYADFQRIPKGLLKEYNEAKKGKNVQKNKYRFIYPYDESRVILDDGGSDYMNASYIEGYNNKKEYIASSGKNNNQTSVSDADLQTSTLASTENVGNSLNLVSGITCLPSGCDFSVTDGTFYFVLGPFKKSYDTTPDFWRMIWQEKCENIVMLTNPVENEETKCVKYWPEPGASSTFGKLQVASVTEDQYSDFTIRIFTVTKGDESFSVRHLHFTAWPDKGVPHDVTSMIEFRQKVRSLHKDKNCPLLVHCSAGIGRTGTFIALDMLTFEGENRGSVDIFDCVAALRSQRCNMVQTKEQYDYLHHAVLHSLTFDCRSIAGDMFLQNYNKLIERTGGKIIIDIQFQHLQSTTDEMTDEDKVDVLRNQSLPHKNRESADIPVDEYRVKLRENRKPGAVDYINAVWINGFRTRHKFIVAQTPLPSTVVDFLTLVHQEKCSCIVMMEEADISNKSVGVYWPADNQSIKHGVFKISCKDSTSTRHYAKKTLSIMCHGSEGEDIHDVCLFIFTNWPKGNAVPKKSDSVLQLVKAVDTVNRSKDKESFILVHCMTGSERSCVYCAVSVLIEKMEIEHEVSVVNTLGQIKARRRSAFSSLDQYKFCHQAVISYLQSFDTYSNFGLRDSEASSV